MCTLADGDDDGIAEIGLAFVFVELGAESTLRVKDRCAGFKLETRDPVAFIDKKRLGPETVDHSDIPLKGLFDLVLPGRHLVAAFQADQGYVFRPFPFGGQCHVDSHITAADDQHILSDGNIFPHCGIA